MTRLAALIPVKQLRSAKQRLSGLLDPAERHELALSMLQDVIALVKSTSIVTDVLVASGDPEVLRFAERSGLETFIPACDLDLNSTLNLSAKRLAAEKCDRILILPTDIPLAMPEDLRTLVATHLERGDHLTVATARKDFGTNGLVMAPPASIPVCFGTLSGLRHVESAQEHGLNAHALSVPGLDLDIDEPADIDQFLKKARTGTTWSYLMHIRLPERLAFKGREE
ncbi:2-phospho-L-lactate guanylyltransferase [Pseudorhodoplanes sp.]|uniref:2-phospho-L-lactate guanylyltransferase n=1 Tax=Pseudorhodoplanes sp. TaxID=1934341 RepID=UPI003D0FF2AA